MSTSTECGDENGWCGYCGLCRQHYQHERDTQDDGCYDNPVETNDRPEVIYWRV